MTIECHPRSLFMVKISILLAGSEHKNNNLKKLLQLDGNQVATYLCLDRQIKNYCDSFSNNRLKEIKLSPLSDSENKNILKNYIELVGKISILNSKSKIWWASDISSKNRLLSPLLKTLDNISLVIRAVKVSRNNSKNLYIIGVTHPVLIFLTEYAKKEEITLQIIPGFFLRFTHKYKSVLNKWLYLIKSIISSFLVLLRARVHYGYANKIDKSKPTFLIKSYVFPSAFVNNDSYHDPFFFGLDDYLINKLPKNSQVVTLSQGFSDRYRLYEKMKGLSHKVVVPVERFIYISDIFLAGMSIAWSWVFKPIKIPKNLSFLQCNLSNTVRELVSLTGGSVPFSDYLYYHAALRIAKKYQIKVCYLTYEGNHWERMFIMGLKEICSNIEVIGYQHSTIPQSAAGVFISKKEVNIIPHPDRVVTTGAKATQILSENSFFPQEKIKTGCALRYQYLYELNYKVTKQIGEKYIILVALEAAIEASELFLYTIKQAEISNSIIFIVRPHPAFPIETMLDIIGMSYCELPHNVEISKFIHVVDDIERSDAILYWGSTVSLEALMMGKPVISFNMNNMLSFDPLSLLNFSGLRWTVDSNIPVHDIISQILYMNNDEFLLKANAGRENIEQYFREQTVDSMQAFLPSKS